MKKLQGYENTFYPHRWEHKGQQICELTDKSFLIFTGKYERYCGLEHEIVYCFESLEKAKEWIDKEQA